MYIQFYIIGIGQQIAHIGQANITLLCLVKSMLNCHNIKNLQLL